MTPGGSVGRLRGWARVWARGALLLVVVACARQGSPTGGPQDRRPPVVVSVEPDTFAIVEPGLDRLSVRFNERISEQGGAGGLDALVTISPEIEGIEVAHDRFGLDIRLPEGLQPGVAYTIRILPEVRDMFGNNMAGPFEWAVSTGAAFTDNAVVGVIWDRATGEPVEGVRVEVVPVGAAEGADTLRFVAQTDDQGLYALRILPEGDFRLTAFQDRNRDRQVDFLEPVGRAAESIGATDTLFLSAPVISGDSTPAVLAQMEVVDRRVVRLLFDDLLDPTIPVGGIDLTLERDTASVEGAELAETDTSTAGDSAAAALPASTSAPLVPAELSSRGAPADTVVIIPEVVRLLHEWEWARYRDSAAAVEDSLFEERVVIVEELGDSARADSLRGAGRPPLPGEDDGGYLGEGFRRFADSLPDGSPFPTGSLILLLDRDLPDSVSVRVRLSGVVNLNGLPDGAGDVAGAFLPPVDSSSVADSLTGAAFGADSAAADTMPPDTARWQDSPRP